MLKLRIEIGKIRNKKTEVKIINIKKYSIVKLEMCNEKVMWVGSELVARLELDNQLKIVSKIMCRQKRFRMHIRRKKISFYLNPKYSKFSMQTSSIKADDAEWSQYSWIVKIT